MALSSFFFMILAFVVGDREWATQLLIPNLPKSGELAILCGAVKINRGGDLVTGKVAEVNLTTGRARIRPGRCTFTVK